MKKKQQPATPEFAYAWVYIYWNDGQKGIELVGIFGDMDEVNKFNAQKHNIQWRKMGDTELYLSLPPSMIADGVPHHFLVRCDWNGGVNIGGGRV